MIAAPPFDAELLRRYDRPGPRYTSYPTAPQFRDDFAAAQLREQAELSNADPIPRPISAYLHVPFCSSPCFYCGCNRIITRDASRGERYLKHLLHEIDLTAPLFDADRELIQLHFGGGTPNFLDPERLGLVIQRLRRYFRFSAAADRDFSIELDPRFVSVEEVKRLAELGLNRASLGVQDFDAEVQQAVNRKQGVEETLAIIQACRDAGMRSVNVDLIYGLPRQTQDGFARTLDTVIAAQPDRLAVYGYAHLPNLFKAQRQIQSADLPDAENKLALLQLAIDRLAGAGYQYIGMDHFALPDDDLSRALQRGDLQRNFMGYTTHADSDLIGFGVSAISHVGDSFSQNPRELPAWEAALSQDRLPIWRGLRLDADDVMRAELIQCLMCQNQLDVGRFEERFGVDFPSYFAADLARLRALQDDGLVESDRWRIRITRRGRLLARVVAMCFDRYLHAEPAAKAPQHARLI